MGDPVFKKVTVIGMGLIGSSIVRGLRISGLAEKIVASDASAQVCQRVRELNLADSVITDAAHSVVGSDLVILCVPPGVMGHVAAQIGPMLMPKAVLTDVGSVKQAVIDAVQPHLPDTVHFIPGHPIAGTEHSGPDAGFAELFQGRWCILTPLLTSEIQVVEKVTMLWEALGARIEIMDPQHHDLVLGITSHLPHLIAYTIVGTADRLGEDIKSEVIKYSASGFRDFTRIASSDPVMWRDVFLHNKGAVLDILQGFTEDLTMMQKAIREGDGDLLFNTFSRTRDIRSQIIDQGQADYKAPGGLVGQGVPPVQGAEALKAEIDQQ